MTTLRDALEVAFDSAESGTLESVGDPPAIETQAADPPEHTESSSETAPRNRDDSGRFSLKGKDGAEDATSVAESAPAARKAPTSWKKDYWGHWEKLGADPEMVKLQDYIEQREGEFVKGVSAYRDEAMKAKDLQEAITPFLPILQQHNLSPAGHVRALMTTHQALVQGTTEQKTQLLRQLATSYGIPLEGVASGQVDSNQYRVLDELNALKSQLGQFQQTAQHRELAEMQSQIEAFKPNAPHFEDVREDMAGLLQSGQASDLKTAYEKACRINDNVWAKVQSEQTAQAQREAALKAQAKKQAAVSTRSSAPTGQKVAVNGDDLRSTLDAAFTAHAGGRF